MQFPDSEVAYTDLYTICERVFYSFYIIPLTWSLCTHSLYFCPFSVEIALPDMASSMSMLGNTVRSFLSQETWTFNKR